MTTCLQKSCLSILQCLSFGNVNHSCVGVSFPFDFESGMMGFVCISA